MSLSFSVTIILYFVVPLSALNLTRCAVWRYFCATILSARKKKFVGASVVF